MSFSTYSLFMEEIKGSTLGGNPLTLADGWSIWKTMSEEERKIWRERGRQYDRDLESESEEQLF